MTLLQASLTNSGSLFNAGDLRSSCSHCPVGGSGQQIWDGMRKTARRAVATGGDR